MNNQSIKRLSVVLIAASALSSVPAHALRCGNKLVKDGMHEVQVLLLCGEPVATQRLGLVLRYYDPYHGRRRLSTHASYYGYGGYQELAVIEMLFNFGPHKLMRKIRFEGGRVVSIETAGYGYREPD